jgi:MerR family mercuric resistance operon transcriptional regulator
MMLTRGELAKQGGVNRETIRYYERNDLLSEPARSDSGYCLFPSVAVSRIHFIKRAQAVGFSLDEIKELLNLQYADDSTCGDVRSITGEKLAEIERKIELLTAMKQTLLVLLNDCPGGENPISECPILEHFSVVEAV